MSKGKHNACDLCSSSYDCQTIATMVTIVDKHREEAFSCEFLAAYDKLMGQLKAGGWSYPYGTSLCRFGGANLELRSMIEELVKAWRWQAKTNIIQGPPTSYAEEVTLE